MRKQSSLIEQIHENNSHFETRRNDDIIANDKRKIPRDRKKKIRRENFNDKHFESYNVNDGIESKKNAKND